MAKLEKAIVTLNAAADAGQPGMAPTPLLLVTVAYIVAVLSVPLSAPQILIRLAIYPIVCAEMSGIGYARIFRSSLWVLPLVAAIGIFNPLLERTPAFYVGTICITEGWVSFASLILRGLFSLQALLILIRNAGFYGVCMSLRRVGCPAVLATQLMMTYRYLTVIIEEALTMHRARQSRGFGRRNYPLKMWGIFIGQLLIRSLERAGRIHRAMRARGFNGVIYARPAQRANTRSILFAIIWIIVIAAARLL